MPNWNTAAQLIQSAKAAPASDRWDKAAKLIGKETKASTNSISLNDLFTEPAKSYTATGGKPVQEKKGWLQDLFAPNSGTTEKPQMSAKPTALELMGSQPINPEQIYGPTGDVSYILKSGGLGVVGAGADLAKAGAAAAAEEINRDHSAGAMASRALGLEKSARDLANTANLAQNLKEAWENRGERGAGETAKDILFSVYDAATKRLKNQVGDSPVSMGAATLAALATNAISKRTGKDEDTVKKETSDRLYSLTDRYDEAVAQHQREGEGRDAATQTIANAVGQVGRMVPGFALSAVTGSPDAGLLSMAGGAGGAAAKEAYQNGASAEQAATIGLEKGLIEYGTEKMFSGFRLMGDGIVSTMLQTNLGRAAAKSTFAAGLKDALGKFASSRIGHLLFQGGELLGENVEEAVSDWLNSNLDSVVYGNGEGSSLKESFGGQMPWTPQGLVTMLTSLIMSGSNVFARGNVTSAAVSEVVDTALDAEEQARQTAPNTQQNIDNAVGTQYNNSIGGERLEPAGSGSQTQAGNGIQSVSESDRGGTEERNVLSGDPGRAGGLRALSDTQRQTLTDRGIVFFDTQDVSGNNAAFSSALEAGKASQKYGPFVDSKSPEQLANTRAFLAENGAGGFAVRNDGDVEAVFTRKGVAPPHSAAGLVIGSIAQGGTKLDCYGIKLVNNYAAGGFVPVAQVDWNQDYAPDGWTPELGTPQVYVMMHNGDSADTVAQNFGQYKAWTQAELDALPRFTGEDGYDNALAYRDTLLRQQQDRQNTPPDNGVPPSTGRTAPTQSAYSERIFPLTGVEASTHEVHSDAQVEAEADARMQDREGEMSRLFGDEHQAWGDTDTEVAKRLMSEALDAAYEIEDEAEQDKALAEVAKLRRIYDAEGTRAGQEMRQRRAFKNSEADIVSAAADILYGETAPGLSNARKMTAAEKREVMKNVRQFAKDAANIPEGDTAAIIEQIKKLNEARRTTGLFSKTTSRTVSNMLENIAQQEGGEAYLRNLLNAQVQGYANDFKAPSRVEQVKTFRVMNLLSKLSTVARNFVSNTVFDPVESLSNNLAIPLDALLSEITGTRSVAFDQGWASRAKRQGSRDAFIKSYLQVVMDAEFDGETGKYEDSGARVFKMGGNAGFIERLLSTYQMLENIALKSTDEFAKGGARAEAQRGVDMLVERGLASQEGLADTAENIAKERTLQENSKLATVMKKGRDALNAFSIKGPRDSSLGAGDMLLPFAQVPANVGLMNIRMNPFSGGAIAVKNLVQTLKAAHNGTLTAEQQRQAVMSVGRALNGAALATIGAVLAAKGIIKVAGSDDKDKAALEKAERQNGMQINLSAAERALGDGSGNWQDGDALMSIGFLEQIAGPLMLGNLIYEAYKDDGKLTAAEITNSSLSALAESMMELPAISQISGLVQDFQYSDADTIGGQLADAALGFVGNTAAGFLVPNAVRGIAQGMDNTVRNTYSSGTTLGNAVDYIRAGIPGLRETLPASVDSWGQERSYTDSNLLNALNANILPGAITQYNTNDVNQEIERLSEAGYNRYPERPSSSTKVNDEQLSAEAQRQFNVDRGTNAYDLLAEMFATPAYQNMTDEQKSDAIGQIYEYARAVANGKAGSEKEAKTWMANAFQIQQSGGDAVGYLAMQGLYGSDMAGAYLNLTEAGVNGNVASQILGLLAQRGGKNQENIYNLIRDLGLDDSGASTLWGAFGYKDSWEEYVRKHEK